MNCPLCNVPHEAEERTRIATITIKGKAISYNERVYYCKNKDTEFVTGSMADENLSNARKALNAKEKNMTEFVVVRFTNRLDGTFGNVVHNFDNEADAIKDYFREAGKAVDSTHLTDSVSLLTKEGFEIRHDFFTHEAPAPEEPEEPVEEPTE